MPQLIKETATSFLLLVLTVSTVSAADTWHPAGNSTDVILSPDGTVTLNSKQPVTAGAISNPIRVSSEVNAVLIEQDFGASGRVTPQTAAKIGKMLGVDLLLTGSVSEFSVSRIGGAIKSLGASVTTGKVVLQARLVNTTTGEIVVAAEEKNSKKLISARYKSMNFKQSFDYGLANEVMHPAVKKMVIKIADNTKGMASTSHSGRVIKVEGDKVWINIGSSAGAKIGDEFDVMRKGEELIDPDTGLSLGTEEEKVGRVVIVELKDKFSIATIQSGNAQANDYLKKV